MLIKKSQDFNLAYEIYNLSFPECEKKSKKKIQEMINSNKYHFYVCEKENQVLGFILLYSTSYEMALIDYLAINPNYRSLGIGSLLLKEMMKLYNYLLIEVEISDNIEGSETYRRELFYKRNGVKKTDIPYELPTPDGSLAMNLFVLTKNEIFNKIIFKDFIKDAIGFIHSDYKHTNEVINKYINNF